MKSFTTDLTVLCSAPEVTREAERILSLFGYDKPGTTTNDLVAGGRYDRAVGLCVIPETKTCFYWNDTDGIDFEVKYLRVFTKIVSTGQLRVELKKRHG